jgi:hypothetical protein
MTITAFDDDEDSSADNDFVVKKVETVCRERRPFNSSGAGHEQDT